MLYQRFLFVFAVAFLMTACGERRSDLPPGAVSNGSNLSTPLIERTRVHSSDAALSLAVEPVSRGSAARGTIPLRVQLRNESNRVVEMMTPSGLVFDIEVLNEQGEVRYRWSEGRAFTLALVTRRLEPGETLEETLEVELGDLVLEQAYTVVATFNPGDGIEEMKTHPALRIRGSGEILAPPEDTR